LESAKLGKRSHDLSPDHLTVDPNPILGQQTVPVFDVDDSTLSVTVIASRLIRTFVSRSLRIPEISCDGDSDPVIAVITFQSINSGFRPKLGHGNSPQLGWGSKA
jgi:hypothetical protein